MSCTSREALESFGNVVKKDFEPWYDRHAKGCYRYYLALQFGALISSLTAAIFAALSTGQTFDAWAKYVIVILPVVGALFSSLLSQLRLYDLWKLREQGRIQVQALSFEAQRRLATADSEQECSRIHEELERRLNEIEAAQSVTFFQLYKADTVLQVKH